MNFFTGGCPAKTIDEACLCCFPTAGVVGPLVAAEEEDKEPTALDEIVKESGVVLGGGDSTCSLAGVDD